MFLRASLLMPCFGFMVCIAVSSAEAQEWPQWRGPNRDARAADFKAPESWPEQLTQKWKVEVGNGVATPALVDGKLYVFARQEGNEVLMCLDAANGKEVWKQGSPAAPVGGPARQFPGPRSSPTVAEGKVVTIGVEGILSCHDAASGKQLWRHDEFKGNVPRFATSSSPIVTDGLCIAQLGGSDGGGILACDLETGKEKWKWTGDGAAYGSPVLTAIDDAKVIVAPTSDNMVALDVAKGSMLWKIEYSQGRYNAATPMVDDGTLIFAGPESGITAEQLALKDGKLEAKDLWRNTDSSVQFNTPVLKDGLLYGLSTANDVFCIDQKTGETLWSKPLDATAAAGASQDSGRSRGGRGRSRGGRRGGGGRGYGSIVDAGSVLFALTPAGKLTVFKPSRKGLERVADYTVAEGGTYAYPVIAGNRIFIKDEDSVASWSIP